MKLTVYENSCREIELGASTRIAHNPRASSASRDVPSDKLSLFSFNEYIYIHIHVFDVVKTLFTFISGDGGQLEQRYGPTEFQIHLII